MSHSLPNPKDKDSATRILQLAGTCREEAGWFCFFLTETFLLSETNNKINSPAYFKRAQIVKNQNEKIIPLDCTLSCNVTVTLVLYISFNAIHVKFDCRSSFLTSVIFKVVSS